MCIIVILTLFLLCSFSPPLVAGLQQEEKLTRWERDYYDLDLRFRARIELNDGRVLEVTEFHSGLGLQRHMILLGGDQVLNIALRAVERIVRHEGRKDYVTLYFNDDVTMNVVWDDYQRRKISGKLPDGTRWAARIDEVKQIEVFREENGGAVEEK
ncbi:MAG TPA: hypothetical protein VMX35_13265 [Acidobacteriota bacterium]|nr:hypothetical protein [Acidobacteriota bacterium]